VVYGVAADYCVKAAVLGLRSRGCRVEVVEDAIAPVDPKTGDLALAEMRAAGAELVDTETVLSGALA
jgi:nicotinamidase/pyrazinamidase